MPASQLATVTFTVRVVVRPAVSSATTLMVWAPLGTLRARPGVVEAGHAPVAFEGHVGAEARHQHVVDEDAHGAHAVVVDGARLDEDVTGDGGSRGRAEHGDGRRDGVGESPGKSG